MANALQPVDVAASLDRAAHAEVFYVGEMKFYIFDPQGVCKQTTLLVYDNRNSGEQHVWVFNHIPLTGMPGH
ncbi:hypothetical protein D3C80_1308090 [compost metagenome]